MPYGSLLPQKAEGLLVPVALSATHVAFSSIRMDPTWMALGQSAGIAAAMSVKKGMTPRELPLEELQKEVVGQKLKIAFYWDVEGTHPAFAEIQLLSAKGVVDGNVDRCFRPDEPLTRAEAARFIFRAFGLWPSMSNVHFTDVPHHHPAFREVETLFDNGAMTIFGINPMWPQEGGYDARQHSGFRQKNNIGEFKPDQPVTEAELSALINWFKGRTNQSDRGTRAPALAPSDSPVVTRGGGLPGAT